MRRYSTHRGKRPRSGVAVPAFFCLLLSAMLLLGSRVGGDDLARRVLGALAGNARFVSGVLALGTGEYEKEQSVHTPYAAAAGREQPDEEDLAETAMENAGLEQNAPQQTAHAESVSVGNLSGLEFDLNAMLASPKRLTAKKDGPQVLIYHTHATEAYTQADGDTYQAWGDARTLDTDKNVVRVGTELCKTLEARGIQTVHLTDLCDYPAYNGSYGRSLELVKAALKKYPTVQVAIDVHRDAILDDDGTKHKITSEQDGKTVAQLMLVMGTNASGLEFDDWKTHLNYAVTLQSALDAEYPGLMRPINLRKQRFNLHLTPGSMLLEVGASGNTLREAIAAVRLFGNVLATELGAV